MKTYHKAKTYNTMFLAMTLSEIQDAKNPQQLPGSLYQTKLP
jgi:hypothetical protein